MIKGRRAPRVGGMTLGALIRILTGLVVWILGCGIVSLMASDALTRCAGELSARVTLSARGRDVSAC